ncbi:uncharacterized protein PODANS_4_2150 [Podospora anserina S mat+]|uniref:Podospora anserina S mat+ genomic DNA chromosome 4, supercontig 1 n=1 Tax=Podospora anserina (strain S / ATCC MYA-4624 / DSM 980 / FGSC 10383) TaxID=515849 RepID=B2ADU9_PODAN|nr:uncharacterized protein PODANS_4_2150 [Podospora anserina S mat+]CAP61614.1 unnamed protein product [Podospora anserina S mat+]CDP27967.1 Putative protein of unknown function [Podospora anserina S mat+]
MAEMAETTTTDLATGSAPTPTPTAAPAAASTTAPAPVPTQASDPAQSTPHFTPGHFVPAPLNAPPQYVSPRSYRVTKLAGRIFSIICCIVAIGLSAGLMADSRTDGVYGFYGIIIIPSTVVCMVWDVAEIICIMKREGNRGIHPGAIVGVDLILWLGLVFLTLLTVTLSATHAERHIEGYYETWDSETRRWTSSIDLDSPEMRALVRKISGLSQTLSAFVVFLTLTHLGLFIIGCIETNYRNRRPRIVYVMAPPPANAYAPAAPPGVLPAPYGAPMMRTPPQVIPMMPIQPVPVPVHVPVRETKPVVAQQERYA